MNSMSCLHRPSKPLVLVPFFLLLKEESSEFLFLVTPLAVMLLSMSFDLIAALLSWLVIAWSHRPSGTIFDRRGIITLILRTWWVCTFFIDGMYLCPSRSLWCISCVRRLSFCLIQTMLNFVKTIDICCCPVFLGGVPMASLRFQAGMILHIPGLNNLWAHNIDRRKRKRHTWSEPSSKWIIFLAAKKLSKNYWKILTTTTYVGR